jgi:hypothetical protein
MSYSTVSNYGGRQPTNTSYIKQFVQSFDDVMAWIYVTTSGTTYIEPSVTDKTLYVPQSMIVGADLTVNGTFSNPSDAALKDEIKYDDGDNEPDDPDATEAEPFDRLRPCTYHYKRDMGGDKPTPLRHGLIAQDVEKAYPELVGQTDDGMKTVNYIDLVPILIAEVQALKKHVRLLAFELDQLADETDKEILGLDDQIMDIKLGYY